MRVGLTENLARSVFGCSLPGQLTDATGRSLPVAPLECWQIEGNGRKARVQDPKGHSFTLALPLRLTVSPSEEKVPLVYLAGKWYRGSGEFRPGLVVINRLDLEAYLYGVVPNEMPAGWPLESLKAQAIAARTYAIANLGQHARLGFDLRPTEENQVYGGASSEKVSSNQAVDATRGQIVTYNGRPIRAYYHSCAGGYTESSESVWGRPIPYIQPVPDFDQEAPRYVWQRQFSTEELSRLFNVGEVREITPVARGYSGRVTKIQVSGSQGNKLFTGEQFRRLTRLWSTLFNVQPDAGGFTFAGRGFGHGLGLSQWGAKALGERGYLYSQILQHYYPSAILDRMPGG